jgi:hypothetical protein
MREVPSTNEKPPSNKMTRRGFFTGVAANAAVGYGVYESLKETPLAEEVFEEVVKITDFEVVEVLPGSESFNKEKEGWQKWWALHFNELLFVDSEGAPVGEVIPFQDFIVDRQRTGADGLPEVFKYRLGPGRMNDEGLLSDNIAGEWIRYVRAIQARETGVPTRELQQRNVTEEFESTLKRVDEPELVESIKDAAAGGNGIESMVDIVQYYGMNPDKKVRGDSQERTRAVYLQEEIIFHNKLPQVVQNELRGYIIGLAAQESRFNGALPKNSATAEGILQLIDDVREENGFDPEQRLSFSQEVDVAGKHFSNVYTRVRHWMKNERVENQAGELVNQERLETYEKLRELFPSGEEGEQQWQKYFLTPCMVNAYNAGSWTIGACLHEFVAAHSQAELQELVGENPGFDLFRTFTHFAKSCEVSRFTRNYGDDAQAYFVSIAAASEELRAVQDIV